MRTRRSEASQSYPRPQPPPTARPASGSYSRLLPSSPTLLKSQYCSQSTSYRICTIRSRTSQSSIESSVSQALDFLAPFLIADSHVGIARHQASEPLLLVSSSHEATRQLLPPRILLRFFLTDWTPLVAITSPSLLWAYTSHSKLQPTLQTQWWERTETSETIFSLRLRLRSPTEVCCASRTAADCADLSQLVVSTPSSSPRRLSLQLNMATATPSSGRSTGNRYVRTIESYIHPLIYTGRRRSRSINPYESPARCYDRGHGIERHWHCIWSLVN